MSSLSYLLAVVGSLLLHGLVIVLMTIGNWEKHNTRDLRPELNVVKAQLVELKTKAPEKTKPKTEVIDLTAQRERERKAEEARKLAQRKRNEEEKRKLEEQKRKKEEEAKKKAEAEKQRLAELERQKKAREAAAQQQRMSEFEQALLAEETYQAELQEQQVVSSVGAEIKRAVELNWSPPPSARRGMQAVLRVSLVPTGGLTSVEVLESSGDSAFDRSVELAVQKAAPFDVIKELSPTVFEQNFRKFQFLFNPKNLRL